MQFAERAPPSQVVAEHQVAGKPVAGQVVGRKLAAERVGSQVASHPAAVDHSLAVAGLMPQRKQESKQQVA